MTMRGDQIAVCKMALIALEEAGILCAEVRDFLREPSSQNRASLRQCEGKLVRTLGVALAPLRDAVHNAEHLSKLKGKLPQTEELFPDSKMTGNSL